MTTDSKYNNDNPQYFCLTVEKVILLSCRCLHPGHIPAHSGARCPVTDEDIFTNLSINNNCGEAELSGDTWPVSVSISGLTSQHDQHKYYCY